jgi:hypothetical protein
VLLERSDPKGHAQDIMRIIRTRAAEATEIMTAMHAVVRRQEVVRGKTETETVIKTADLRRSHLTIHSLPHSLI